MEVRLTDKGREFLGWSPDRLTARVADHRAFTWMQLGYAVEDKGFMALYNGPKEEEPEQKPDTGSTDETTPGSEIDAEEVVVEDLETPPIAIETESENNETSDPKQFKPVSRKSRKRKNTMREDKKNA